MTHTEKVHVLFGLGVALLGLMALHAAWRPASLTRYVWPALSVLIGVLLFVPVEAGTRTYQEVSWLETWHSWVPQNAATWLSDWFTAAAAPHVIQHKVAGVLAMAMGIIAFGRARGRLAGGWERTMPTVMIATGLALGVHGGGVEHLPTLREQAHHWILGAGFGAAGISLWLVQRGTLAAPGWRFAWPAIVALTGLDLVLFYRLAAGAAGHGGH